MVRAAIIGGSGYTGLELLRILGGHPQVELVAVTSRQAEGQPVNRYFPSLDQALKLRFVSLSDPSLEEAQYVFTALPHKAAMGVVKTRLSAGQRVIDLSADFRFRDALVYERHYGPHVDHDLCRKAVYGLAEVYPDQIASADLVAGPGCYPTCSLLPLIPLLKKGLIDPRGIIINAASGVSGAGRTPGITSLMSEAGEDFKAYKISSHRHRPEIEQELSLAAGESVLATFTPHLIPMSRGMLDTIYVRPKADANAVRECWQEFYAGQPFVRILESGQAPRTVTVRGSNSCHLAVFKDENTGVLILLSALDNLVKGASGQAVQCLNLMAGLDQRTGLSPVGLMP